MFIIFQEVVKKYGKRALPFILLLLLFGYFLFSQEKSTNEQLQLISSDPQNTFVQEEKEEQQVNLQETENVIVDVKGAVKHPGVYELTTEHRIIDAIKQAGGYTKEADSTTVNHAQKLQDEMVIYIPKKGEDVSEQLQVIQNQTVISANSNSNSSSTSNGQVNINTANESELTMLSGIGPSKAQAIIAYREENGPFKTIDEIKNVSGIGEKTFEKLKDSITVN